MQLRGRIHTKETKVSSMATMKCHLFYSINVTVLVSIQLQFQYAPILEFVWYDKRREKKRKRREKKRKRRGKEEKRRDKEEEEKKKSKLL